jgi:hypothetical protein
LIIVDQENECGGWIGVIGKTSAGDQLNCRSNHGRWKRLVRVARTCSVRLLIIRGEIDELHATLISHLLECRSCAGVRQFVAAIAVRPSRPQLPFAWPPSCSPIDNHQVSRGR